MFTVVFDVYTYFPQECDFVFVYVLVSLFQRLDVLWVVECGIVRHDGDRRAGVDDELLFFFRLFLFRRRNGRLLSGVFWFICVIWSISSGSLCSLSSSEVISNIFQVVDSFCFVWFRTAYPGEVSCFLTIIAFYRFSRAVVLVCLVLLSTKSTVVFFCFCCSRNCFAWIFWIGSCFISVSFASAGGMVDCLCRRS